MPYYRSVGEVPRKRHTQFRQPDGSLYAEELMGQEGFSSDSSLLYHRHLPTAIVAAEEFTPPACRPGAEPAAQAAPPAHPQARRRRRRPGARPAAPARQRRRPHLVRRSPTGRPRCTATPSATSASTSSPGTPRVESTVRRARRRPPATTSIIPTSAIHRIVPTGDGPLRLLAIEASGHIGPPKRYLSVRGQFLEHAPYCERDLRGPGRAAAGRRRGRRGARPAPRAAGPGYVYAHHPFDVVGWDGASTRGRSPSTTSSRSPAGSTSRRRCTRPSRARTS